MNFENLKNLKKSNIFKNAKTIYPKQNLNCLVFSNRVDQFVNTYTSIL